MTKEEAIKKLADIIFYVSKLGYIPYDTDDEFCAVNIAKKHIGQLLPSLPSDLDEAVREKVKEIFDSHEKYDIGEEKNRILLGLLELEAFAMMFYDNGVKWMAEQGFSYQGVISADKTIPVLPMKDVSDMGLDYGDKVIVQIRKI